MKLTLMQRVVSMEMNSSIPKEFKHTASDVYEVLSALEKLDPANLNPEKVTAIQKMLESKDV